MKLQRKIEGEKAIADRYEAGCQAPHCVFSPEGRNLG
jgi:hypothetical protein